MSPEQAQGKQLDARSDLYSLGALLYHMLTGAPPFEDDNAIVVMSGHIASIARPVADVCRDVPSALSRVVARTMAKLPAARPSTADELSDILVASLVRVSSLPDIHEVGGVTVNTARRRTRRKKVRSAVAMAIAGAITLGVFVLAATRDPVPDVAPSSAAENQLAPPSSEPAPIVAPVQTALHASDAVPSIAPITISSPQLPLAAAPRKKPVRIKSHH
jgi:serine/threonine-protein kinase